MEKLKPTVKTIAVLPFINMSGSRVIDYIFGWITGQIFNAVAGINHLKATSGTAFFIFTSLAYKN